ncbi:carboxypeptidase C [Malassezia cuniculi]|uniref:Carboxypeptidase n=1 Tax=Malassezia cuniculi TaxID=948313 RepID=A0AAF0EN57_9BASI|nr:carboxypeptidase C [Malassezia cuniculi]
MRTSALALVGALSALGALGAQTPFQVAQAGAEYATMSHPSFPAHSLRIRNVPGEICEPDARSWSGYLDVDLDKLFERHGNDSIYPQGAAPGDGIVEHFYFWAFESRDAPETDPFTLWLNGGPGCSSFIGLLMELGPCSAAEPLNGMPRVTPNPWSFNSHSNMVFLDQPVGVGFSYASWKNASREDAPPARILDSPSAARDVSAFLHLLNLHAPKPKGQRREFHMAGESYAGRYLPLIAAQVLHDNDAIAQHPQHGIEPLPLASVLIGNGITSPFHQNRANIDYACTNISGDGPFLSNATCAKMEKAWPVCQDLLAKCNADRGNVPYSRTRCSTANTFCEGALSAPWEKTNSSFYDYKHEPDYAEDAWVAAYLNAPKTRAALGVDARGPGDRHDGVFTGCSDQVFADFGTTGDGARDTTWAVAEVLERGVRVLDYSGRRDFICNFVGNARWIDDLEWSGKDGYRSAPLEPWYVDGKRAGEFRHYGNLTFAIVDGAGHFVPHDQPINAHAMFNRWIHPAGVPGRLD